MSTELNIRNPLLVSKLDKVFTESVYWKRVSILRYSSDLGDGVKADVYPGAEDTDTVVSVSLGDESIYKEIEPLWLENWFGAKE